MKDVYEYLEKLRNEGRLRKIPTSVPSDCFNLSSNDYLALSEESNGFLGEFFQRFGDISFSSSASRLLSARQDLHSSLESFLKNLYSKETLIFNSGYHANVGCISALTQLPKTLFLCDRLVHASIIDGLRMASAEFRRFPHNDIITLKKLIAKYYPDFKRIIIVVESIYSMDGDEAPLKELSSLKDEYPDLWLYVDEAHAFGVRGERGLGCLEEQRLIDQVDIIIGTFGKAAASTGAFVACNDILKDFFINYARPFIFSTALPPVNIAWSMFMVEKIIKMSREREWLKTISLKFNNEVAEITGKSTGSTSQIVPLVTGSPETAVRLAEELKDHNILALPVRQPTVPPGTDRIRFSLHSDLTMEGIDLIDLAIKNCIDELCLFK